MVSRIADKKIGGAFLALSKRRQHARGQISRVRQQQQLQRTPARVSSIWTGIARALWVDFGGCVAGALTAVDTAVHCRRIVPHFADSPQHYQIFIPPLRRGPMQLSLMRVLAQQLLNLKAHSYDPATGERFWARAGVVVGARHDRFRQQMRAHYPLAGPDGSFGVVLSPELLYVLRRGPPLHGALESGGMSTKNKRNKEAFCGVLCTTVLLLCGDFFKNKKRMLV